jgi:hypothetical protein
LEDIKFSDDITDDELMVVSNAARMEGADLEAEKKKWRKVTGTLLDTSLNDHGFSLSPKALSFMESHFKKTKDVNHLHNFFKNHQYYDVEALMGRHVNLEHKKGKKHRIEYSSLLDRRHPLTDRADAFRNVSATIAHGDQTCSNCDNSLNDGAHSPSTHGGGWHPVSNKAIEIETSFVTFPAYKSTTVEMSSLSSLMSADIDDVFPPDGEPDESGGEGDTDAKKKAELKAQEEAAAKAEKEAAAAAELEKAEYKQALGDLRDLRDMRRQLREVT